MTRVLVTWADPERVVIDYLEGILPTRGEAFAQGARAGLELPSNWQHRISDPFVTVELDGTSSILYPIYQFTNIRCVVWHSSPTKAKALANLVMGLLASRHGTNECTSIIPVLGVQPAKDPDSGAAMASISVSVTLRSILL